MEATIAGKWFGFYKYPIIFSIIMKKATFTANFEEVGENNFKGVIQDDEVLKGVKHLTDVTGNISENLISFVKEYPSYKVYYKGKYDDKKEKFIGTWSIPNVWSGYWEMIKQSDVY
jgi:hypothetical protein